MICVLKNMWNGQCSKIPAGNRSPQVSSVSDRVRIKTDRRVIELPTSTDVAVAQNEGY